jgi:kynurenine formamidase
MNALARMVICALLAVIIAIAAGSAAQVSAQTREKGPWWPHPIWGSSDQAGGSNWITPAKVLEAIKLVKTGRLYELGQVYEYGMPLFGQRTYTLYIPGSPTGGPVGTNNLVYHDELVIAEIGQVGTQFDGLGHIGTRMKMADGTTKDVFYNGVTVDEMRSPYGLARLGIEHLKPFVTRGLLIDIAGYKEVETLPNSYQVTVADVRGALKKQGIAEDTIKEGDALFFRYGWSKLWREPDKYNTSPPGIGLEVARWIVDKKASMIGSDQWTTEVVPNPDAAQSFPVHQELITKNGIFNLENMVFDSLVADRVYEFLFIFTPIRFKGGTGSPGRPLAIR